MFRYLLFSFIVFSLINSSGNAQGNVDQRKIDSEFKRAVELFDTQQYDDALLGFEKIINEYEVNSKTTASYFFKIKILIEEKHYAEASSAISFFIENYPNSKYTDEIRILLVKIQLDNFEYSDALKELATLIDQSKSILYRVEAKVLGEKIADNYLNSSSIKRLNDLFTSEKVKPYLLLLLAKSFLKEHQKGNALSTLSQITINYTSSEEYTEANNLYHNPVMPDKIEGGTSLIAVLLPLQYDATGNYTSTAAGEILDGIKFAVSEFNRFREDKIGIVIRDTRNDEEQINTIRNELGNNADIKAMLGPVFSNEVRVALKTFDGTDLPIISPTATDNDLTSISEDFFQANPPIAIRGKIMAQYVYFVENKRSMAVLNAIDGYSPLLAATFADEFEKLGGTITVKATYKSNSFSLSEPITEIEYAGNVEGIYIPLANKIDATAILSQLGQDSIYLPIYGNQDWFSAKGFESSPELSNMLTFSSDYFIDFNDEEFKDFGSRFSKMTGKDPNRNVLYGYDAAKYILTVMRNIVASRSGIKNKMISGMISTGLHNNISFDENRMNRYLNIVRYKDGVFELIEKFRSGN